MFKSARIKLTAWYLLIIMIISLAFSAIIYQMVSREIQRFALSQRIRIERGIGPFNTFFQVIDDDEIIREAQNRLLILLGGINGGILVLSGIFGYILAGRTLQPIQNMISEQNRFVSDSSHELRTPLTSLKSSFEVNLRDPKLTLKEAKTLIKESIDEVDKLTLLSNNLLTLAQFDQMPESNIVFTQVSLKDALTTSIHKIKPRATQRKIKIIDNSHNVNLNADKSSIVDLFTIILDNAIKYSPDSTEINITSRIDNKFAEINFIDQGIGIDKKDLPHIFDRFYRADTARSKNDCGGNGLGLSIAQKITDLHHGSINVISRINHGSTFTIRLPIFS